MPETNRVAVVILAAGGSSRMGRPKQNLQFRGKTLLQATIDAAKEASKLGIASGVEADVFVVLGANEFSIREKNDFDGCEIIVNERWSEGLSSSIRCALSHLESADTVRYDAALFTVADLAYVDANHLLKLLEAYAQFRPLIVCSAFNGGDLPQGQILGVPALFRRNLFEQLMQLSGDVGAKAVIAKNVGQSLYVKIDNAVCDIDTEADYLRHNGG